MERWFNTAGPCDAERHYMVPAAQRLEDARPLIERGRYFAVHAPRQTGKTTTLRALARELTESGRWAALHFSCERAASAGDDYKTATTAVLAAIRDAAVVLPPEVQPPARWPRADAASLVVSGLRAWAMACPRPLVLFFDEIDALTGEGLRSVLHQLREGYLFAPKLFPASVVLCGLRDVRDYKAASGGDTRRFVSSSPFNIKDKSLLLGNFEPFQVRGLYRQHTQATGQVFTDEALTRVLEVTAGQPWLVNALAREVVEEMAVPPDQPITADHIDAAKERLIIARATHLDSLLARLHEPRVQRVIEPMIAGLSLPVDEAIDDDVSYVRDLGLIGPGLPLRMANPIYREVILRVLGTSTAAMVSASPRSFVTADGRLDFDKLLREFAVFWKEHAKALVQGGAYHEAAPQIVLTAFLQRLVNGGGFCDREYAVGRGRVDVLIRWPCTDAGGRPTVQREAIELKVWAAGQSSPLKEGLAQLDGYLDQLSLDHGTLVIFDRRPSTKPLSSRVRFDTTRTPTGRPVTVLRA